MRPTIGCLIRFKDSAATLPRVLMRLHAQTRRPDVILGVDTGSSDDSAALIQAAGGEIIHWRAPYSHPSVTNFGMRHLHTDLVLILSSHTTLDDDDAIERMVAALADPRVACVSAKWDDDPFYSDAINWEELRTKGLKFGSIYSNSMGMIRRDSWIVTPFDETLPTAEDYAWAIEQVKRGRVCRRLDMRFGYQRSGNNRDGEFASVVFQFARRHQLRVAWLGVRGSIRQWIGSLFSRQPTPHYARLKAWLGHFLVDVSLFIGIEPLQYRTPAAPCSHVGVVAPSSS
jgi:glycosyltransferase involved in cell wall biosynthesis